MIRRANTFLSHKYNICCRYAVEKYILFSCLDHLGFYVYLNINKNKTILSNTKFVESKSTRNY